MPSKQHMLCEHALRNFYAPEDPKQNIAKNFDTRSTGLKSDKKNGKKAPKRMVNYADAGDGRERDKTIVVASQRGKTCQGRYNRSARASRHWCICRS